MNENGRKGRELLGMPVYTVQEGKRLGDLAILYVSRGDSSIAAVKVAGNGRSAVLPYRSLRLVGEEIVLVESEAVLEQALPPDAVRELDSGLSGRPVLTQSGERLGTLLGLRVDTVSGRIEAYRVRPESGMMAQLAASLWDRGLEIATNQVVSLGQHALIVHDEAARPLEDASPADQAA